MAKENINDIEYKKFALSALWDVALDVEAVTEDPLWVLTWSIEDLEFNKHNTVNDKVRVVFTI